MGFEKLWQLLRPTFDGESSRKWHRSIALELTFSTAALRTWHIKGVQSYGGNKIDFEINSFMSISHLTFNFKIADQIFSA